jgi:hypothetical protein
MDMQRLLISVAITGGLIVALVLIIMLSMIFPALIFICLGGCAFALIVATVYSALDM